MGQDLNQKRLEAQRVLFESCVVRPVVDASRKKLASQDSSGLSKPAGRGGVSNAALASAPSSAPAGTQPTTLPAIDWSLEATGALVQLIRLESMALLPPRKPAEPLSLDPLFAYVLSSPSDLEVYRKADGESFQKVCDWAYSQQPDGWKRLALDVQAGTADSRRGVETAVGRFNEYWAVNSDP